MLAWSLQYPLMHSHDRFTASQYQLFFYTHFEASLMQQVQSSLKQQPFMHWQAFIVELKNMLLAETHFDDIGRQYPASLEGKQQSGRHLHFDVLELNIVKVEGLQIRVHLSDYVSYAQPFLHTHSFVFESKTSYLLESQDLESCRHLFVSWSKQNPQLH